MKLLAQAAGWFLVVIAVIALVGFLLSLIMCIVAGWGPQGPMDPGWGIVVIITAGICFVTGIVGLLLIMAGKKSN